jgi:hypothetical protein
VCLLFALVPCRTRQDKTNSSTTQTQEKTRHDKTTTRQDKAATEHKTTQDNTHMARRTIQDTTPRLCFSHTTTKDRDKIEDQYSLFFKIIH